MAAKVLVWRFDHIGDCNRYGNCVDHPYYERPTMAELESYPDRLPNGANSLLHVGDDMVTSDGTYEQDQESGYELLRERSNVLWAAVGEAIHQLHHEHPERVLEIVDSAISGFDR